MRPSKNNVMITMFFWHFLDNKQKPIDSIGFWLKKPIKECPSPLTLIIRSLILIFSQKTEKMLSAYKCWRLINFLTKFLISCGHLCSGHFLYVQVKGLTCHRDSLGQTECDRLPISIMKLCHSLGVPVYLGQEHASAAGNDRCGTHDNFSLAS